MTMRSMVSICAGVLLAALPAQAASPAVAAAVQTFDDIAADTDGRHTTFCIFTYVNSSIGGDVSPETEGFSQAAPGL